MNNHAAGLSLDNLQINQKENTNSFVMNGIQHSGSGFALQSEPGNELCISLPENYTIVGTIYGEDNETYIFSTDGISSEIGVLKTCEYTSLINNTCLSFSKDRIIQGEYRVRKGCNRTLYWNDGNNKDMFVDLDDIHTNCDDYNIKPKCVEPCITFEKTTGNIERGSYSAQIEYLDDDLNVICKSGVPKPIYIKEDEAFKINVSNIDLTKNQIRINIVSATGKLGINQAHSIGTLFPVSDNIEYTYSGFNVNTGDTILDYTSVLQPIYSISSSVSMEQVQNRFVRANIKEEVFDYSLFQQFASKIKVNTVINKVPETEDTITSLMANEVYDLGIIFIHDDGTESPTFHIPGYTKQNKDEELITVSGKEVEKWTYQSTAIQEDNKWTTGYYECQNSYVEPECTTAYWGTDYLGNAVTGNKRYHRTPSRGQIPVYEDNLINRLGFEFSNLSYPAGVVGHYFVYANAKEIQDTGLSSTLREDNKDNIKYNAFSFLVSNNASKWSYLATPKTLARETISGQVLINSKRLIDKTTNEKEYNDGFLTSNDFYIGVRKLEVIDNVTVDKIYTNEESTNHTPGQKTFNEDNESNVNLSLSNYLQYIKTDETLNPNINELNYISIIQPNNNLCNNTKYTKFDSCSKTLSSSTSEFNGDSFISNLRIVDIKLVSSENGVISFILNQLANAVITAATVVVGVTTGDLSSAVGALLQYAQNTVSNVSGILQELKDGLYDDLLKDHQGDFNPNGEFGTGYQYYGAELLDKFYIDSYCNFNCREQRLDLECGTFFDSDDITAQLINYVYSRLAEYDTEEKRHAPKPFPCLEQYLYNEDYNITSYNTELNIPSTYQWCSKCLGHYPHRIVYSPVSFNEEITDSYTTNLVDDYIDIPSDKGEIVKIKYTNNQLFVHTTQTTFILKPYPQTIATDQDLAYIKTNDFFSIPPSEIIQTDIGYGGLKYPLATSNTQYGYTWVDTVNGKIINYSNKLDETSKLDLNDFLDDNLPKTTNNILVFDPIFERHILYTDKFVLSYSNELQQWVSFHSYLSDYAFNTNSNFYSVSSNSVWRHNKYGNYQRFFNTQYPFTVEFVDNDLLTDIFHSLHFHSKFESYNGKFVTTHNTFTKGVLYNSCQSTGLFDIVNIEQADNPYGNLILKSNEKSIIINDFNHKLSGLFDYAVSKDIQEYTDIIQTTNKNFINVDFDKSPYSIGYMRDKYQVMRLEYLGDNRVTHFMSTVNKINSIR